MMGILRRDTNMGHWGKNCGMGSTFLEVWIFLGEINFLWALCAWVAKDVLLALSCA